MPTDLEHDSPRVIHYVEEENELARQNGLDLANEERDLARSPTTIYQQGLRRYHSRRVRSRTFREGDLVLRLIQDKKGMHKLSPPWEGPFIISRVLGNDSYYLVDARKMDANDEDDDSIPAEVERPWNVDLLHRFYT